MRTVTEFAIGAILRTTFAVLARNLPAFALMGVLALLPQLVATGLAPDVPPPAQDDPDGLADNWWRLLSLLLLSLACTGWLTAGLSYGVIRDLRGGKATFPEIVAQSIRAFAGAFLVVLVTVAAVSAGLLLLIVPGVIIGLMFCVAVPAAVVERLGAGAAIRRSVTLTNGHKGEIFVIGLVLVPLAWIAIWLPALALDGSGNSMPAQVVGAGLGLAFDITTATLAAVIYHDLRMLKDGAGQPPDRVVH